MRIKARKLAIDRAKVAKRGCFVTGMRVLFGHNVSNSNVKTRKIFKQNLTKKTLNTEKLGKVVLAISRRGERTIEKYGGLEQFLSKCKSRKLTLAAVDMKKRMNAVSKETSAKSGLQS